MFTYKFYVQNIKVKHLNLNINFNLKILHKLTIKLKLLFELFLSLIINKITMQKRTKSNKKH